MAARLSFDERCVISAMVGVGASAGQIADELGRHSSRPTNSSHMRVRVGFQQRLSPAPNLVVHRVPITTQLSGDLLDRASQFPDLDGHPPGGPRRQQPPYRTNHGALLDERPNRTPRVRARPPTFPPPQPHRPAERRQINQHHAPIALGPHRTGSPPPTVQFPQGSSCLGCRLSTPDYGGPLLHFWWIPNPPARVLLPTHFRRAAIVTGTPKTECGSAEERNGPQGKSRATDSSPYGHAGFRIP